MLPEDTPPAEPSAAEGYQLMQDAEPTTEPQPVESEPADTVESEQPAPVQSDQPVQGADAEAIEDLQQLMQRAQRPRVQQ